LRLQKLARGDLDRPLVPVEEALRFEEDMELDYPVELLEPLSFILSRMLGDICRRLAERGLATNEVRLLLHLEDRTEHARPLRLPVPMCDPRTFLKLMHLDLNAHPPAAPVVRVRISAEPVKPRTAQEGLFIPASPEPEKLEVTLARIAALVGEENAGSAELLDTHRPDAFRMRRFAIPTRDSIPTYASIPTHDSIPSRDREGAVLAFRYYRPPRSAKVQVERLRPVYLLTDDIRGKIVSATGPWRTSGDWWTTSPWDRDEWDIGLQDGSLYRIYREPATSRWFVEGSFD
jgi:protein ImuB